MNNSPTTGLNPYYVRILFGPMFGADILISGEQVFFCIGKNTVSDVSDNETNEPVTHSLQQAINTLYIPHRDQAPNIRLRFNALLDNAPQNTRVSDDNGDEYNDSNSNSDNDADENNVGNEKNDSDSDSHNKNDKRDNQPASKQDTPYDFVIDYLMEDGCETRPGQFNTVCQFDGIAFAIKRQDDVWSEEVEHYTREPNTPLAQLTPSANDEPLDDDDPLVPKHWWLIAKISAILVIGVIITVFAAIQIKQHLLQQKAAELDALLAQAPGHNYVLPIQNGLVVLNTTQDGAQWDRQALLKAPQNYPVRIAAVGEERQRLETLLDQQAVPFITVRMDDPENPVLVLSADTLESETRRAEQTLAGATLYAHSIIVTHVPLDTLDADARALLASVGCPYRRIVRQNGVTYQVTGALSDESLVSLQRLVSQFSHKWGTRTIDFRVQMRTDWLKGKTYQDGSDGYVLLDPASWYFPQPL